MLRTILKSKIHKATITGAQLHYEGSLAIDEALLKKCDILPGEKIEVFNFKNGARFETYAIKGKKGEICLKGPAAHLGKIGDQVVVVAYGLVDDKRAESIKPKVVYVDAHNRPKIKGK